MTFTWPLACCYDFPLNFTNRYLDFENCLALRDIQRMLNSRSRRYFRPWLSTTPKDSALTLQLGRNRFECNLDVQQFKPEEITVKVTGENIITVEGKHEEKEDEHGFIYRHFVRKYILPKDFDIKRVESRLSSDGILKITTPKIHEFRNILVVQTGQPLQPIATPKTPGEGDK